MAKKFEADVSAWVRESQARLDAVTKQSAQDVFTEAQKTVANGGNMPVDTGFLRNSLATSLNGGAPDDGPDSYTLQIARMKAGDALLGAWTAEYAVPVHYGSRGRPGRFWRDLAAMGWQAIVRANAAKLRARAR